MSSPKKHRPPPRLRVGANVVSTRGRVTGVDPFTLLVVTRVHADGTVDLAVAPSDLRTWQRIPSSTLLIIEASGTR